MLPRKPVPSWLFPALLVVITVSAFWPATRNSFINYDDGLYVTSNVHVQTGLNLKSVAWALQGTVSGNWHPLTMLSHTLDCQCYGLRPAGHHATSIVIHTLNAALLFSLLKLMTRAEWRSFFVAALFAVHPLRVESVAWVAERKDVLSGFFGLLSLIAYARFARLKPRVASTQPKAGKQPGSTFYWMSLLCLALGLMSKPMLVTWPFLMLVLDFWPLERLSRDRVWGLVKEKIPFLAVCAAACIVTYVVQVQAAAMEAGERFSLDVRLGNALISYCRYIGKFFWPFDLAIFYPHPGAWPVSKVLLAGACLLGICIVAASLWRRVPYFTVGWFWFVAALVPVIGLVQVGDQALADRYTYLPGIGLALAVVWGLYSINRTSSLLRAGWFTLGLAGVGCCVVLTRQQINYWKDSETIFSRTLELTKDNYLAHNNLGTALAQNGQVDEAIEHFRQTIRLRPNYVRAYYNLGNALSKKGLLDDAIAQFQETVRRSPASAMGHNNLANALLRKGRNDEAIIELQEAIRLAPNEGLPHSNLGYALLQKDRIDEAISQFREALRLQPELVLARANLDRALNLKNASTVRAN